MTRRAQTFSATSKLDLWAQARRLPPRAAYPLAVAIVVDFLPDEGGTGEQARVLALELRRRGHDVTVVSRWPADRRGERVREIRAGGIEVVTPKWLGGVTDDRLWPGRYNVARLRAALRLAWRRRSLRLPTRSRLNDPWANAERERTIHQLAVRRLSRSAVGRSPGGRVIHVICRTTTPLIEALRTLGWPIVFSETGQLQSLGMDAENVGTVDADVLTADSQEAARTLAAIEGRPVEVVPSIGGFPESPTPQRGAVERLISVGRLVAGKHVAVAVRALAKLPTVTLEIHGSGEEEQSLRELATQLGVADRVRFHGYSDRDAVRAALDAADAFVLCSESEGTPCTVMEAMSRGRPIVTTPVGGVLDLIAEGREGLFFDGSVEGLVEAVMRLQADPEVAARLGTAGRARWEREFRLETVVDRYEAVYRAALTRRCA